MSSPLQPNPGRWAAYAAEPYRLFFPLGALAALLGGGYWLLLGLGLSRRYAPQDHGLMQVEGFAGSFAVGFLLTALPRFMDARPGGIPNLAAALALQIATIGLLLAGHVREAQIPFLLLMAQLLVFAGRCHLQRTSAPPPETLFAVAGLLHGLLGAACLVGAGPAWQRMGLRIIEQGMLLALVLGIGSFLIPRLLGLWEPVVPVVGARRKGNPALARQTWYVAAGALLFLSFWLEAAVDVRVGRWLRVAVLAAQVVPVLRLHRLPRRPAVAGILLWLSFWFVLAGQVLNAVFPAYESTVLHVTLVGGFGLMVLMIGMRVTVAHGGCEPLWQSRALPLAVAALVFAALGLRFAAVLWPTRYVPLLAAGGMAWMLAVAIWAAVLVPRMNPMRRPPP